MRICNSCGKEFQPNAARNVECNPCRDRKRRQKARDFLVEQRLSKPCAVCGENDPDVIQFHHKDPNTKYVRQTKGHRIIGLAGAVNSNTSINAIKRELEKCIPLCANCHIKVERGKINVSHIPTISFAEELPIGLGKPRERKYVASKVVKRRH